MCRDEKERKTLMARGRKKINPPLHFHRTTLLKSCQGDKIRKQKNLALAYLCLRQGKEEQKKQI